MVLKLCCIGMACWNGVLEWRVGMACWNGVLEWRVGMTCWNGVLEWRVGMACWIRHSYISSVGRMQKTL
jgi:hypothetical protein